MWIKRYTLVTLYCLFLSSFASAETVPIQFSNHDRVLIIAPHPDDETLGAGGVLQSAAEAKADVRVLYLTHGDLNEMASIFYQRKPLLVKADSLKSGRARKKEAISAMSVLGVDEKNLIFFGYPEALGKDQAVPQFSDKDQQGSLQGRFFLWPLLSR